MNHKINDMELLARNAMELRTECVDGSTGATEIVNKLKKAIDNLKGSWKGKDAEVQINNVIGVSNGMVDLRSALGKIARASSEAAKYYRDIQAAHAAEVANDTDTAEAEKISPIEIIQDKRDMIDITPEAAVAREELAQVQAELESFRSNVSTKFNSISGNWEAGVGREDAVGAYSNFESSVGEYIEILEKVKTSISNALTNYNM